MDHYLNSENTTNRLIDEYVKHGSLVIAFDFDEVDAKFLEAVLEKINF